MVLFDPLKSYNSTRFTHKEIGWLIHTPDMLDLESLFFMLSYEEIMAVHILCSEEIMLGLKNTMQNMRRKNYA